MHITGKLTFSLIYLCPYNTILDRVKNRFLHSHIEEDRMEGTSIVDAKRPHRWWIRLCQRIWSMHKVFWSTFGISALASILAALLFFRWPWSVNPKVAEDGSFV